MLSLQAISDRLEIQQLLVDYATAIDSKDFKALERVFADDAYIDYRVFGGIDGDKPTIIAWLAEVLGPAPAYQHLVGNADIRIDGDRATGRIMCFNPMALPQGDGVRVGFYGLWYVDQYVRTPDGWRISRRSEERSFTHNIEAKDSA